MRSYLLGQLPDDQAAMLEEEYFINREILLKMQSEEAALITDYLDGNLPSIQKQSFESRYLQVPLLQQKVEEARRQRRALKSAMPSVWTSWRVAFALASVLLLGLGIWTFRSKVTVPHESASTLPHPGLPSIIAVRISPGRMKGPGSPLSQFEPPVDGSVINLILELPGQSSPAPYQALISRVNADGHWLAVWNSPGPLVSSENDGEQALKLKLDGPLLQPGDYVVEAWTANGRVRETYIYRINKARPRDR